MLGIILAMQASRRIMNKNAYITRFMVEAQREHLALPIAGNGPRIAHVDDRQVALTLDHGGDQGGTCENKV